MNIEEILDKCDHTLLGQTATWEQIRAICDDGMKYHCASVCIPASYVKQAKEYVGDKLPICTVTESGAEYIKTSTGFSTAGATFHDVELFAKHVGEGVKIKAAGGISSLEDAQHFIDLGASRLGTSRVVKIVKNGVDVNDKSY